MQCATVRIKRNGAAVQVTTTVGNRASPEAGADVAHGPAAVSRVLALVLLSAPVFAAEVEVPLGARAPLKSRKAITEVVVRDPSLVTVVVTDGAVSLEGKQSGVTGITVTYAD